MEKVYIHTEETHNTRAADIIVPIINKLLTPKSVIDVGCGLGTWLKVFQENANLTDCLGLDGSYLDKTKLVINHNIFKEQDLRKKITLNRNYDLALCLEVAEHLPETSSDLLIESLCSLSDNIVFSAAIPGQGGQNHINEQWPQYWLEKFSKYGFKRFDVIRPLVWENENVDLWYKQNMFLFSKNNISTSLSPVIAEIHPGFWELKREQLFKSLDFEKNFEGGSAGIKRSSYALFNSILKKIKMK